MTNAKKSNRHDNHPVRIVGEGRDEFGNRYFKFRIEGHKYGIPPIRADKIASEGGKALFARLANAGWNPFTTKSRSDFLARLQEFKPCNAAFEVVTRLGWNSRAYVFPNKIVGKPSTRLELALSELDPALLSKYRARGTLGQWQRKIGRKCIGNSRLMFTVSLAFTGPILRFVTGPKSGGFQIWGDGETGKTTAAIVAGSVWGCHRSEGRREKGFIETWNSTFNKVEVTALAHNDSLLILDETKRSGLDDRQRANVVTSVAFGLAEQTEKERLTNPLPIRAWRLLFLSTSNLPLAQIAARGGVEIDEAHLGRLVDIPLPANAHGIYERLNGFPSGEAMSNALQQRSRRYYGTPIRRFVRMLTKAANKDESNLKLFLKDARIEYRNALPRKAKMALLTRASDRFATTYAAGCLAIKYGILPWKRRSLLKSIISCQIDQLQYNDDRTLNPVEVLKGKLIAYLKGNLSSFIDLDKRKLRYGRDEIDEAAPGYRAMDKKGHKWLYLTARQFDGIVGSRSHATALKQALADEGLLAKHNKTDKFVVQRRVFEGGRGNQNFEWVLAIKAEITS